MDFFDDIVTFFALLDLMTPCDKSCIEKTLKNITI